MSAQSKPVFGTEQERAKWAWEAVDEIAALERSDKSDKVKARYGTRARKLPSYLQVNGLGQTLAFLYAKGKGEGAKGGGGALGSGDAYLLRHLRDRVLRTIRHDNLQRTSDDVMATYTGLDPDQHRLVSAELAATAQWLKRFAEGRLEEEQDDGGGSS